MWKSHLSKQLRPSGCLQHGRFSTPARGENALKIILKLYVSLQVYILILEYSFHDLPLQIQFPTLDIRLSYNDVQLFLAIAKSIPTGSPSVADPAFASQVDQSTASPETTTKPKDSFRLRTEVLLGMILGGFML